MEIKKVTEIPTKELFLSEKNQRILDALKKIKKGEALEITPDKGKTASGASYLVKVLSKRCAFKIAGFIRRNRLYIQRV